jgi:hypothetical protein
VRWRQIFVGPQYGTCFMSSRVFRRLPSISTSYHVTVNLSPIFVLYILCKCFTYMNFNLQPNILIFTYYIFGHELAPLVEVGGSISDGVTGVFP